MADDSVIHESTLFHLLLLTELVLRSASFPTPSPFMCGMFGSMVHHLDRLLNSSKKINNVPDDKLVNFAAVEDQLESLPRFQHTAAHFKTLKMNESLLQLYVDTEAFRVHVDWLKAAKENLSLPFEADEGARAHLQHLAVLLRNSIHQINEETPQTTAPSLPVVSNSFEALIFSVEISERLQAFSFSSKRILRHFHRKYLCPRH
ncbi:uncharacterized protein LOC119425525 [Nematolebias whitei]|uniref:uncharacterized protein LOC119425525 n=1 Tax=Nematolebias whitei TaxID=451745 RepID=UPI00189C0866|nr:uncharacterized protein LOC119425525 [Nematolebias whitei]